jgi:choline monooxygenase
MSGPVQEVNECKMFLAKTHSPQLLKPGDYASAEQYAVEVERILKPAWHFVGTMSDIPRPGDYLTDELFGEPLLVRNVDGKPQVFLNVCSHRFCALVSHKSGHDPKFRCQYHGWEYDCDGNTRKIPDAPSFRPLEKGTLGLIRFRTECCGQLIFMTFSDQGPSLREHLAEHFDRLEECCRPGNCQLLSAEFPCPVNWKIPTENSLESYHIDCVHPSTFGKMPPESECSHEVYGNSTVFNGPGGPFGFIGVLHRALCKRMGVEPTSIYKHTHIFPNFTFLAYDLNCAVQTFVPTSPTSCRFVWRWFSTMSSNPFWNLVTRLTMPLHVRHFQQVSREDSSIYPSIQRGLSSPRHPPGGLLATREERLRHFQEYVHRHCRSTSIPAADAASPCKAEPCSDHVGAGLESNGRKACDH